jgi:hypothetical protein
MDDRFSLTVRATVNGKQTTWVWKISKVFQDSAPAYLARMIRAVQQGSMGVAGDWTVGNTRAKGSTYYEQATFEVVGG